MNKTPIKNFSVWAREKLIDDIKNAAMQKGISAEGIAKPLAGSSLDMQLFDIGLKDNVILRGKEITQRNDLAEAIRRKAVGSDYETAFNAVMEEIAYTWFNRLIAIRFMEVNDYLPSRVRVISSEISAKAEPDLVTSPFDSDLDFTEEEQDKILDMRDKNDLKGLFNLLFIKQCNKLHEVLPRLFEKTNDYTELLLNIDFTDKDGIIYHLVHDIDEDDWRDQVQIIGWLYQYYISEKKNEVFANLKKNVKITKENVPAATQLFTPDWIVRYMVENSLGRIVISRQCSVDSGSDEKERIHREQEAADKFGWKYYLPEAEQTEEVRNQLNTELSALNTDFRIEDIKLIDPCMGSGHILEYAFDVFMQIYEGFGYTSRDAVRSILENNLYGLDIDKRAVQLAYFSVIMKARQYDRRVLGRGYEPHLYAVEESNGLSEQWAAGNEEMAKLFECMRNAEEYGSLVSVPEMDFDGLREAVGSEQCLVGSGQVNLGEANFMSQKPQVLRLIEIGEILAQKYDVVVTNPPYMGSSGMGSDLSDFVKKNYPDSKSDLFAVFIERGNSIVSKNGYKCMVTMQSWMFLSSFEKMRKKIIETKNITNLMHMENMVMGIAFGTAVTVFQNSFMNGYKGTYNHIKLKDIENEKPKEFPISGNRFNQVSTSDFSKIPGSPVAYWVSGNMLQAFDNISLYSYSISPSQNVTGNNNKFVRKHWELNNHIIGNKDRWIFYAKGGGYRKWWGNLYEVVNWTPKARHIYQFGDGKHASQIINEDYWYKKGITWGLITSAIPSFRIMPEGATYDKGGSTIIVAEDVYLFTLGLLNSKVYIEIATILNPTLNFQVKDVRSVPLVLKNKEEVENLVNECIKSSKSDWDSFETSWDFSRHPLVPSIDNNNSTENYKLPTTHLEAAYEKWENECNTRFSQLKANEEELNRIFIDIYGLQDELTPEVEDKDVTVRKADLQRDIRSLISYAVGCMFGRYSLDTDGLAYAGGEFNEQWVVVSGQYYNRKVVEYYVSQELSRSYSMAKGNVLSGRDLYSDEAAAESGNVFTFGSNEKGSSVNPFKYRRGTSKAFYEGIHKLSVDCEGVEGGTGNSAYDLCSPEILDAITNADGKGLVSRGWEDAERIDWKAAQSLLTTDRFCPVIDNAIPITDEPYLQNDIVSLFCDWLKKVYGADTLEKNLSFIAKALGNKGDTSRQVIRNYFMNDFIKDHIKIYQKRPIYWLFDSGKKNGFKCLVYMHRWNADTAGKVRVDYLHKLQHIYEFEIQRMQETIDDTKNPREAAKAAKRKDKLQKQLNETKEYDTRLAHIALSRPTIDLDDGVKVNYEKVQTSRDGKNMKILAKI